MKFLSVFQVSRLETADWKPNGESPLGFDSKFKQQVANKLPPLFPKGERMRFFYYHSSSMEDSVLPLLNGPLQAELSYALSRVKSFSPFPSTCRR